jgi:D-alanyl-D-alanine carboxypeptidase
MNHFVRLFSFLFIYFFLSSGNAFGFDPALASKLQVTLDSMRNVMNLKGISSSVTIPGQGTWFGVSGVSHQGVNISKNMYLGIASNTKTFMSVLVLKLREQNLLNLDDSIYHWIDNYQYIDSTITIRQLLNHTSGIYDVTTKPGYADSILSNPNRIWTTQELLVRFLSSPYFPKGQGFQYSNTNYLLLGLIVKAITNSDVSSKIRQLILNPLNLSNTFFAVEESVPDTIAHPWANGVDINGTPRTSLLSSAWSAGAMYSNSENMTRWYQLLFGNQVLNAGSMSQMLTFTPQSGLSYGLGVIRYVISGRVLFGHSGSIRGYTSSFLYDTTSKTSIIVMINQYPGNAYMVSSALFNTILSNPTSIRKVGFDIPSDFVLEQNYPNPFNLISNVKFQIINSGIVKIKVYDMLSREVKTLVNEYKQPGTYQVSFNAEGLSSGVYFYKMTAGDFSETKKLLLLK